MSEVEAKVPTGNMEVSATIVRACRECGGTREIGKDCVSCGLAEPPEVINLGVISAQRSNPLKSFMWDHIGTRLADRRIRKANKAVEDLCGKRRSHDPHRR